MRTTRGVGVLALVLLAAVRAVAADAGSEGARMKLQDAVVPLFGDGPLLDDPGFEAWLQRQGAVKLPFTVWRTPRRVAAIGVHPSPPARVFRLDDSALGIALDDRLRTLCGDAEPCRVWLSGRLGASLPLPGDEGPVFGVHAVHERVAGEGPHAAQFARRDECLAIRALKPLHCARGPLRCEACKAAQAQPARPKLLDLCPWYEAARPVIELERGGETLHRPYDVLRTFTDEAEARAFARKHGLTDVKLP